MPRSQVVITGLGVVSSIGIGCDAYLRALLEKKSGITSLANRTDEGATPGAVSEPAGLWIGGPIIEFDAKQYVRPRKAMKVMCREIQTAYVASQLAIEFAGLAAVLPAVPGGVLQPSEIGTVFGSEMFYGPPLEMVDAIRGCMSADGTFHAAQFGSVAMKTVAPLWMLKYLPNMPACHVGIAVNALGPNNTLVLGDVSGPAAVIEAASCIDRKIAKMIISGATGSMINTTRMNYRHDLPIPDVFDPIEKSSRPHDPQSKGVVGGEGAATLILEHPDHAARRGAVPIARLTSYAQRFAASQGMRGGLRSNQLSESPIRGSQAAIQSAIETAMADAQLGADQIGLVVSHGTGDPVIDRQESAALRATLKGVPATATIAALGHTGAACGMIDLLTGALALSRGVVPPTIQARAAADVPLLAEPAKLDAEHVLCLSHTSEGSAIAIVLSRP
jgi:3-oxoacyl-[acyl-carrier-protein] synthase II